MLIKNINFIDTIENGIKCVDMLIEDGIVSAIEESIEKDDRCVIDGEGLYISHGLIDTHVHFRDPGQTYKEDLTTGSAAAKRGGYTAVLLMANTKPVVDNTETLEDILARSKNLGISIYQNATVTKGMLGEELVDMDALHKAGAVGFTDDGKPIMKAKLLYDALIEAKKYDAPISLHEEDPFFIKKAGKNETAPAIAEAVMVARDAYLAVKADSKLNFQHISSADALEIIRNYKKYTDKIFAEVTPHHFTLTEEAVEKHGTLAKMNPPLRTAADREAIIRAIKDGTIDIIATDHAPHAAEEKAKDFFSAPSGIIGLETALPLAIDELHHKHGIDLVKIIKMLTVNPARLYGLEEGSIRVGSRADLVIFDINEEYIYEKSSSKSQNSPFIGEKLKGKVKYTIKDGKVVYSEDNRFNC